MKRALAPLIVITVIAVACGRAMAGAYFTDATCDPGGQVTVSWYYYEDPSAPSGHSEWVGYDVLRRPLLSCEPWTRVNATSYARTPGISQGYTFSEPAAAAATMYEYKVIQVDPYRNELLLGYPECDLCGRSDYVSCPQNAAAVTQGTLYDLGWTLLIQPCGSACYPGAYISGAIPDELRSYAGTPTVVRFYGDMSCTGFEGCALAIDHYEVASCVTATARTSWGRVKTLYR